MPHCDAMNPNDEQDDAPREMISQEDFMRKLREDPEFAAGMRQVLEDSLALPDSPETEAMKQAARTALQFHVGFDVLGMMEEKMETLVRRLTELKNNPDADGLREVNEQMDAITDEALDLPEPHRTAIMAGLTATQSHLRKITGTLGSE